LGKNVSSLSAAALEILMKHSWPGNIRELEDAIERAVYVCSGGGIQPRDLPPTLHIGRMAATGQPETMKMMLGTVEKELIVDALRATRGNMSAAARQLGISGRMIGLRLQKYGIDAECFKRRTPKANRAG
jgi:Nif-specific regulatory protein